MGRGTKSDIVFFEQLGRALSVREDTEQIRKELIEYDKEDLMIIAFRKGLEVNIDMPKEEIIEILLSPIVIDLTNNFDYIKELENNLKDRVEKIKGTPKSTRERMIRMTNTTFDIDIINQDLFEMLKKIRNKLAPMTWASYYEMAKSYYNHYKTIKMKEGFKTFNGIDYDENGINLYAWVMRQKGLYKQGKLDKDKIELLDAIGVTPQTLSIKRYTWEESYALAKSYYKHHGNLNISKGFKTSNGYEYDDDGYNLYNWLYSQRNLFNRLWVAVKITKNRDYYDEVDKKSILKELEQLTIRVKKLKEINYTDFIFYIEEVKKQNKTKRKKKEN